MTFNLESSADKISAMVVTYVPMLVLCLLTLVLGLWLINKFALSLDRNLTKQKIDPSLSKFLVSLTGIGLKVLLFISAASMVGIKTTSFVAVIGAAGLAVGLALQGSLSNFAGGALILLFRPYRVGDFIEAQGQMGTVQEIQVFTTILKSPDNKRIIIPNGPLAGGTIVNFNVEPNRRIDWTFGIGYTDNIPKAKQILHDLINEDSRALKNPSPMVVVSELADNSVNLILRAWVRPDDYWGIHFDMIERVKLAFDKNGISIPFPQRDVHLYTQTGGTQKTAGVGEALKN